MDNTEHIYHTSAPLLFSYQLFRSGAHEVNIAFTSVAAGNVGLHVDTGEPQAQTLRHRLRLEGMLSTGLPFLYLNQVHGTTVVCAEDYEPAQYAPQDSADGFSDTHAQHLLEQAPVADAAYSTSGRPLAIMVADCIPVVLVGQRQDGELVLAVAHAGRKGLLDGVLQRTVVAMHEAGAENICAWLGPSICGSCYEVPEQMRTASAERIPQVAAQTRTGTPALNLPAGAIAILEDMGVEVSTELAACTYETGELYSHRAFTHGSRPAGRIAGLVWLSAASEEKEETTN